jgi:hypothetical protein
MAASEPTATTTHDTQMTTTTHDTTEHSGSGSGDSHDVSHGGG